MVTSLAGAQGQGQRETRLTAIQGYQNASRPETYLTDFGFAGTAHNVRVEMNHESGRSDILVETNQGVGLIEAKVDATDAQAQAARYPARWRVLLTQYTAIQRERARRGYRFMTWQELHPCLVKLAREQNVHARFVASDLLQYLKEHGMISENEQEQVYAREINEQRTLSAFLKCRLYFCRHQKGGRLPKMSYFAPHFGQQIAHEYPGIRVGISYVARIVHVEVVEGWTDLQRVLREYGDPKLKAAYRRYEESLKDGVSSGGDFPRSVLFLGEPRLVFNPPIRKKSLQAGSGWLSKWFYSFDDLFKAWAV
jgi:hypothetical protein